MAEWTFLTNHARALACIADDPGMRLRDIAASLEITERNAFGLVTDLATEGYVVKEKEGRRNRYRIQPDVPLREGAGREQTLGELLSVIVTIGSRPRVSRPGTLSVAAPVAGPDAEGAGREKGVAEWHGRMLLDRDGGKIGKLQDVYVDVETDEPQFATVKGSHLGRHLTFVPLGGIRIGPDELQVEATKEQIRSAPDLELHDEELSQGDESRLYHHFQLNYTPPDSESGRRLARR